MIHFHTEYNIEDPIAHSNASGLECKDKSLAQQQFKDQCDINVLFARYLETGEIPQVIDGLNYGNFEGIYDFQTAMNAVRTAEGLFSQLPARIKNRFDNDPQKLLEFLADPANAEEAIFLKLAQPKETSDGPSSTKSPDDSTKDAARTSGTTATPPAPDATQKP